MDKCARGFFLEETFLHLENVKGHQVQTLICGIPGFYKRFVGLSADF